MEVYITYAEYAAINPLTSLADDNEFTVLAEFSSRIIDRLSMNKIETFGGLSVFSAALQDRVKRAMASQIDTLVDQGSVEALTGSPAAITGGFSLGRFSENSGGKNKSGEGNGIQLIDSIPVSPMVKMYLQPTKLLNRALNRPIRLGDFL